MSTNYDSQPEQGRTAMTNKSWFIKGSNVKRH